MAGRVQVMGANRPQWPDFLLELFVKAIKPFSFSLNLAALIGKRKGRVGPISGPPLE